MSASGRLRPVALPDTGRSRFPKPDTSRQIKSRLLQLIYRDTAQFPATERFGLAAQMRRCAVSIPSNISEGSARNSTREFVQFLGIACGAVAELETQVELATRLGYLKGSVDAVRHVTCVRRLVNGLRKSMRARICRASRDKE
jgi:four helix bundle protein